MNTLKDDRSWIIVMFLSIFTLGIYAIYFLHVQIRDTNIACATDGKRTPGMLKLILLSIITFFIYYIVWDIKLVLRWQAYVEKNGDKSKYSILIHVLFTFVLSPLLIFPIIASFLRLSAFNQVCETYNILGGETVTIKDKYSVDNLWGWKESQSVKQETKKNK